MQYFFLSITNALPNQHILFFQWKDKFQSALDIGAGKGRPSFFFAENGLETTSVDLSESSITIIKRKATEKGLNIHALAADMACLPFNDSHFDCVVCFHTIFHTNFDGIKKALREIHRVLKNNGEAFISFISKENQNHNEAESTDGFTIFEDEGGELAIPHCYLNENDLFEILSDFQIISRNKVQNYVHKGNTSEGIHFFVHVSKKTIK